MLAPNSTYTPPPNSPYPAALEHAWASLLLRYPATTIDFVVSLLNPIISFWIPGFILTYLLPSPPFTKIQPVSRQPSNPKILRGALISLRNQAVIHGLHAASFYILHRDPAHPPKPRFRIEAPLPGPWEIAWQYVVALVIREAMFYYSHRVFHWRGVYQYVHKMHHEFVTPTAWSAQYCTVLEHLVANVLPILIPGVLLK